MRRAAIFALGLVLAACGHAGQSGYRSVPDTLHVGTAIEPNSFNPVLASESIENDLDWLVFDGLTQEDDRNAIQPDLASAVPTQQNGGISKDGKTVTYHLRSNVLWQDGVPFTSRDVKFTWQAIMNPSTLVGNRVPYDDVSSVDTPDAHTAVFHLKQRFAPFVAEAFNSSTVEHIIPEHLLKNYHDLNRVPFNYKPIGTGPYRMVHWAHGDRIEFAANPRYFKGAPKIAKIVVHEIPEENTGMNELRSHEIQWYPYISEASYNLIKGTPGIRIVVTPQNAYRAIYINTERPILSDVRVRRAIAYAVDKNQLVNKVTHGTGAVATEDIPDFMWAYYKDVPVDGFDPAKARELLDAAGWHLGSDGVRVRDGRPLAFTMALRQGAAGDNSMAVMVQSWLRDVGMQISIKSYPGSMLFAVGPSGVLEPGKYDLDISGFSSTADPDNSAQFMCSTRPPNGFNWTRYCNPRMDALQSQALTTYDQAARKVTYAKIETLLSQDVPQVYIYYQPQISAVDPALQNFKPSAITPMWNVNQWAFAQS